MKNKTYVRGALLTILGGIFWGFSGTCGQFLLQQKNLTSEFLVPVRLFFAGMILLIFCWLKQGRQIFEIWKTDKVSLIIFGILGMSMCQYTYFSAIGASNAGTATVLQYTGPVMILIYLSLKKMKFPSKNEVCAIILAVFGTFLLATHGNVRTMVLSGEALFWGLLAAVSLAVYTLQPGKLLEKYGAPLVTAWGMVIGGVMLCLIFRPWLMAVVLDGETIAAMGAVIFFGTILAFCAYLEGVRLVGPKKGSLYASIEPVAATVFSAIWLHVSFGVMDLFGFLCILSTIFLLSVEKKEIKSKKEVQEKKYGNRKSLAGKI